jgi:regulator of nonsense transcripts 1
VIPLIHGCKKLVLVGDHKQLGPIILDKNTAKSGYKQSLFERMVLLGVVPYLLCIQYRMHPLLSEWPSNTFYNGSLLNGVSEMMRRNPMTLPFPTFFYACYGSEEVSSSGTSFLNQCESIYCEELVKYLFKSGVGEAQIGIITPYEGQRTNIVNRVTSNLEVSNVDSFQGREKDYIIVSMVRSNTYQGIGFVGDKRRLNVTLTRARYGTVIIGNPLTLMKNELWKSLLEFYQEKGLVFEGPLNDLRACNVIKKKKNLFDFKAISESLE